MDRRRRRRRHLSFSTYRCQIHRRVVFFYFFKFFLLNDRHHSPPLSNFFFFFLAREIPCGSLMTPAPGHTNVIKYLLVAVSSSPPPLTNGMKIGIYLPPEEEEEEEEGHLATLAVTLTSDGYSQSSSGHRLHRGRYSQLSIPNHQRWYAKWKLSRNMCTLQTRFCTFGANLYAESVIM